MWGENKQAEKRERKKRKEKKWKEKSLMNPPCTPTQGSGVADRSDASEEKWVEPTPPFPLPAPPVRKRVPPRENIEHLNERGLCAVENLLTEPTLQRIKAIKPLKT